MSATDELRRLLDERGVEWDELVGHPVVIGTAWYDRDGCPCTALEHADDVPDGLLSVQANLTPEQAIDATLGRGECTVVKGTGHGSTVGTRSSCSMCGGLMNARDRYCRRCGRKVMA